MRCSRWHAKASIFELALENSEEAGSGTVAYLPCMCLFHVCLRNLELLLPFEWGTFSQDRILEHGPTFKHGMVAGIRTLYMLFN